MFRFHIRNAFDRLDQNVPVACLSVPPSLLRANKQVLAMNVGSQTVGCSVQLTTTATTTTDTKLQQNMQKLQCKKAEKKVQRKRAWRKFCYKPRRHLKIVFMSWPKAKANQESKSEATVKQN